MGTLDDFFPYPSFRPYQQEMLAAVAGVARNGGIAMIDAPTGSGKSSVIASLLSEANGRKIVVAVRTKSQLTTFIRELELIRKKQPGLRYAYLIGKRQMCPAAGEGDTYRVCEGLKSFSTALLRDRAKAGSLIPAKDRVIEEQRQRDVRDSTRADSPLRPADGAVVLDTSELDLETVITTLLEMVRRTLDTRANGPV